LKSQRAQTAFTGTIAVKLIEAIKGLNINQTRINLLEKREHLRITNSFVFIFNFFTKEIRPITKFFCTRLLLKNNESAIMNEAQMSEASTSLHEDF
jgi:hypothetical protein